MRRHAVSILAFGAVAGATGAGALAALEWLNAPAPTKTQIAMTGCGISPGPPEMALPLELILEGAGAASVSLGPFDLPGVTDPVTIRFEAAPGIDEKTPWRDGGLVTLPVHLAAETPIERVTLRCRHGQPARVSFHYAAERLDIDIAPRAPQSPGAPGSASARRG